ncbi:acetyltransferase (GNAT) family domain-containing protein [Ditylenchus destructor]|nr:acetyltransferase (GNAT) family domain-containing protein [Ditylenchus destructor]
MSSISSSMDAGALVETAISSLERCMKLVEAPNGRREITIEHYRDETQMPDIMRLIACELSEPYSIYTYRYFIHNWPGLTFLARDTSSNTYVGVVVCKLEKDASGYTQGYIAMLAVDVSCRRMGIGTRLVQAVISTMSKFGCDEIVLETEVTNVNAMNLYSRLGFIREKRLFRYYLNGVDAFRLKLFFTTREPAQQNHMVLETNNDGLMIENKAA